MTDDSRLSITAGNKDPLRTTSKHSYLSSSHQDGNCDARVCLIQPKLRLPEESPTDATSRVLKSIQTIAASNDIDLFVLPELAPIGYSEDTFQRYLPFTEEVKLLYQEMEGQFKALARDVNAYICFGTIGWNNEDSKAAQQLYIRQVVVDRTGQVVAIYDKTHLCDYGDCSETRFFTPGAGTPVAFSIDCSHRQGSPHSNNANSTFRFGIVVCADMRYPLLSRALASSPYSVDCILQPAAFSRDSSFRTWKSFRETRAVENAVYWMGNNYAGESFGESNVVPPWVDEDNEPFSLGCEEGYLIGTVSRATLDSARTSMPFYCNLLKESWPNSKKISLT